MGLFGLFKKEEKAFSVGDALAAIKKELAAMDSAHKSELYSRALSIRAEFTRLSSLIEEFTRKEIQPRARSSAKVKERFCEIALDQLAKTNPPSKENPSEYIRAAAVLINGLGGLTERQLLHLGVIFTDEIQPIARKMKEINSLLDTKDASTSHRRAVALAAEISELESSSVALRQKTGELRKQLSQHETKKTSIEVTDAHTDNSSMLIAERKVQKAKQEIDSLLSVQKILRKYTHDKNLRDELIEAYIDSPSSALMRDEHFRIIRVLMDARSYDDTGKVESVVSREHELRTKRAELIEALRIADREKRDYEQRSTAAATRAMESRRKLTAVEIDARDAAKLLADAQETAARTDSALAAKKVELYMLASDILKAKITD